MLITMVNMILSELTELNKEENMERLALSNIRHSQKVSGLNLPQSIYLRCNHCDEQVSATRVRHTFYTGGDAYATIVVNCTSCNKPIKIWIPKFDSKKNPAELYMYGVTKTEKSIMADIDILPKGLQDAYLETVDVFKANKWAATSVMCRRTLEAVVYYLNGADKENKQSLFKNLEELPDKVDLTKKIIDLGNGIRKAGNFGAHFDEDIVPDEELADMLLEYIEYFIEFSFVLPHRVDDLNERIAKLKEGNSE